jgi:hypothetical protein
MTPYNSITMKHVVAPALLVLMLILSSCEKVIEAKDLPQQDPMLVVNCLLYPDSQIVINASSSKSILSGKDYKYVADAVCDLYENDTYLATISTGTNGNAIFPALAKKNTSYSLKVGATGFKSVNASTSIPDLISVSAVERYDTTNSKFTIGDSGQGPNTSKSAGGNCKFRFMITDDLSKNNYYGLKATAILYDGNGGIRLVTSTSINSNLSSGDIGQENDFFGQMLILKDQTLVNGNQVQGDISVSFSESLESGFDAKKIEVYLEMYNLNEDYYKYQRTFNEQAALGADFFSEPVLVYNNIKNGAGIMAGASLKVVKIYPQ